jgi:hypothetical protein
MFISCGNVLGSSFLGSIEGVCLFGYVFRISERVKKKGEEEHVCAWGGSGGLWGVDGEGSFCWIMDA